MVTPTPTKSEADFIEILLQASDNFEVAAPSYACNRSS
jgi:hypothetical protein